MVAAPFTYFTKGEGARDFSGSEVLAKRDFESMKDAGIFFGYYTFHQIKSTIT